MLGTAIELAEENGTDMGWKTWGHVNSVFLVHRVGLRERMRVRGTARKVADELRACELRAGR